MKILPTLLIMASVILMTAVNAYDVRPVCTCYQEYNQANNRCDPCPAGQLSGNGMAQQNGVCRV